MDLGEGLPDFADQVSAGQWVPATAIERDLPFLYVRRAAQNLKGTLPAVKKAVEARKRRAEEAQRQGTEVIRRQDGSSVNSTNPYRGLEEQEEADVVAAAGPSTGTNSNGNLSNVSNRGVPDDRMGQSVVRSTAYRDAVPRRINATATGGSNIATQVPKLPATKTAQPPSTGSERLSDGEFDLDSQADTIDPNMKPEDPNDVLAMIVWTVRDALETQHSRGFQPAHLRRGLERFFQLTIEISDLKAQGIAADSPGATAPNTTITENPTGAIGWKVQAELAFSTALDRGDPRILSK